MSSGNLNIGKQIYHGMLETPEKSTVFLMLYIMDFQTPPPPPPPPPLARYCPKLHTRSFSKNESIYKQCFLRKVNRTQPNHKYRACQVSIFEHHGASYLIWY